MVTQDKYNQNKYTIAFNCLYVLTIEAESSFEAVHKYFEEFDAFARQYNTEERYIKLSPPTQSLELYAHSKDGAIDA